MTRGSEGQGDMDDRWCILRTGGARTLPLAASLAAAGFNAWTPQQVTYVAPTKRKPASQRAAPIVPTFVFVGSQHVDDLFRCHALPVSPHPAFSILQVAGGVPLIGGRSLAALREEEARAQRMFDALAEARDRDHARRLRADQLRTEQARRKALRTEIKAIDAGATVEVTDAPAFAGMVGTIISGNGRSYVVGFGGSVQWKIEAWQLVPVAVCSPSSRAA